MSRTRFRKLLPLVTTLALILPLLLALASPVSAATLCVKPGGPAPCYASIQDAVNAAGPGDVIDVYPNPSAYIESVDLGGHSGALTLRTVNAAGNPTPHTAKVNGGTTGPAFNTSSTHSGNVTINGFVVKTASGSGVGYDYHGIHLHVNSDVVIRNVTASNTGEDGIRVDIAGGSVTITDCTANGNDGDGIHLWNVGGNLTITGCTTNDNGDKGTQVQKKVGGDVLISDCTSNNNANEGIQVEEGAGGKVAITDCTANGNDGDNIYVHDVDGDVTITGCITNGDTDEEGIDVTNTDGDVTIRDCTANDNSQGGIEVRGTGGIVTISNCTAIGNGQNGTDPINVEGDVRITDSVFRLNEQEGVDLDGLDEAHLILVNGNIICDNEDGLWSDESTNAEANWWGDSSGPTHLGNPGGSGDTVIGSGPVDYTPWIDTVTASAPASVMAGSSAVVTFQFSDSAKTVFLGEGPGDLHGDPTFVVTTDNGTVTDPGFINAPNGVLQVTLVPASGGTATVTVDGPCGLDALAALATWEFVPEPGSVVLLASGLVGLAGYAGLRCGGSKQTSRRFGTFGRVITATR